MTGAWLTWPRPPLAPQPREAVAAKAAAQRMSFSSPQARAIWQPRLVRLARAAMTVELEMVRRRQLPATLIWTAYANLVAMVERVESMGLVAAPVKAALAYAVDWPTDRSDSEPMALLDYALLVSVPPLDASVRALALEPAEAAAWFGYPPCCARAWGDDVQRGRGDPLTGMLARAAASEATAGPHAVLGVLGLGPVRHAPCSANCDATAERSRAFIALASELGFVEEAQWLEEMAEWSIAASVVNGVAQIKTGAFRSTWLSDEIAPQLRMHLAGRVVPDGAPQGLAGIFARPDAVQRDAASAADSMVDGLVDVDAIRTDIGAGFAAAGFDSSFAMRSRFSTVVWEQTTALRRARSAVHLGCGQGLLLELLAQTKPRLQLYGTEEDVAAAEAARCRNSSSVSILCGSYIDTLTALARLAEDGVDIAFVDPERLVASGGEVRSAIRALARSIVVIGTDRSLRRFGDLDRFGRAAGFALEPGRPTRASAVVRLLCKSQTPNERGCHEFDVH